jgi:stringent starvation protein A
MSTQNKRTTMTLYASDLCPYSHRIKVILAEKGVMADVVNVDLSNKPEELYELNPYGMVPTLMGRDLIVYESPIIFEYIEERFPHPPMLSVFPAERAKIRLLAKRLDLDWMPLLARALQKDGDEQYKAKVELVKLLLSIVPIFNRYEYFMSNDYSIVDCTMSVILYNLPKLGIALPERARPLLNYADKLFQREAFQESLEM